MKFELSDRIKYKDKEGIFIRYIKTQRAFESDKLAECIIHLDNYKFPKAVNINTLEKI